MIQLNRGSLLYGLASIGKYVEDARTENLFDFSVAVVRGIFTVILRSILVLFLVSPLLFTIYWLALMAHDFNYVRPPELLQYAWWAYGIVFIIYVIQSLIRSMTCPSPSSKAYRFYRKVSMFLFRVRTNKKMSLFFTNRE